MDLQATPSRAIFVTGATGFLGGHFLFHLSKSPSTVTCLVRANGAEQARARVLDRLKIVAASYALPFEKDRWHSGTFDVVLGDISLAHCGVSTSDLAAVRGLRLTELWHFAASLNFEERRREKVFTQNIEGTRNALEFARDIGAKRFVYISTAYTAGATLGEIPEQLHPLTTTFNNFYEESKCHAEHEVVRFCAENGIDYRIARPSIVVGPSQTHRSGGTDVGLYGVTKLVHRLRELLANSDHPLTILGDPETPLHLVPIDHVVADLLHLIETDFAGGPIYHLTSDGSLRSGEALRSGCERVGVSNVRVVESRDGAVSSPLDRMVDKIMGIYACYYKYPKLFARSLPGVSRVTPEDVSAYVHFFLQEHLAQAPEHLFTRSTIASFDGAPLTTYVGGKEGAPAVVLVNAFGMPVEFWIPIAKRLIGDFRVITWDSRGVPSFTEDFRADHCAIRHHADDLARVMDASGIESAHIVGWCTGAQVALKFGAQHPGRALGTCLLNGTFSLPDHIPHSQFKKNVKFVMPKIAQGMEFASRYHEMIYGNRQNQSYRANTAPPDSEKEMVMEVLSATDELLLNMTSAPYRTPETLYRYANMVIQLMKEPEHAWTQGVEVPVLIVAGLRDEISHPDESREVARLIGHSTLLMLEDATHFALYNDPAVADAVVEFVRSSNSPANDRAD